MRKKLVYCWKYMRATQQKSERTQAPWAAGGNPAGEMDDPLVDLHPNRNDLETGAVLRASSFVVRAFRRFPIPLRTITGLAKQMRNPTVSTPRYNR